MLVLAHSVTITPRLSITTGKVHGGTMRDESTEALMQITPISSERAFADFGIELTKPHLAIGRIEDANVMLAGTEVTWGSRVFEVKADCKRWEALQPNFFEAVLEERQFAPNS